MSVVIIGSYAAQSILPDFPREPNDLDIVQSTNDHSQHGLRGLAGDIFRHPALDSWIEENQGMATLDTLYTFKVSHSYWELKNGSWEKHLFDLRYFLRRGARLDPELHSLLYKIWCEIHGSKRTNLAMEKDAFFKDAVVRIYDHDSIHDSVAYGDDALYNKILKDGSTVDVDSKKMWALDFNELVQLFREEVCATALERIVIPRDYRCSAGAAYRWALRRTITSLTKGKSAQFIVENFEEFAIPDDYVGRHKAKRDRLVRL